ncbi:MAG: UDP-N-acetylmuramoyl-L-alanyl-D-glutamate--2,6-diaminopimelate ligase [Candidatus Komeilibacteria bacterium]|nr:UDP-N-acetylmuramoyl-L-alanyl-D-glutamate--2,6-diaminopimelate ligase [Candidatus Komeilibacteria bacterium]
MKALLKKLLPSLMIGWYHKVLAILAMVVYGNPSGKLIVVGVTGTNGKSTTVNLIAKILEGAGDKVGFTTTANFKVADKEWLNDKKMTMLGRMQTQKLLANMVKAGCKYAVIETSSEGIKQYRHIGINYDITVFTNLTPEHLEAHGGFENYKKAKGELFRHLTNRSHKIIDGKKINKIIVANADDEQSDYFLNFKADKKITYSINKNSDFKAQNIQSNQAGSSLEIGSWKLEINLIGEVNIYNSLAAVAVAKSQNIDDQTIQKALVAFKSMPGRFEWINEGQNFKVMVDYAPEPESMTKLYETLKLFNFNNIIHVLGSCGGGRDKARQPILGKMAADNAQYVIVANEDPYDDDPLMIINNVADGAIQQGKILNQNLFKIEDRREAIKKALSFAKANDLVLITGKGCEQYICVAGGQKIPWDDREVVKELLAKT